MNNPNKTTTKNKIKFVIGWTFLIIPTILFVGFIGFICMIVGDS